MYRTISWIALLAVATLGDSSAAGGEEKTIRLGLIGLDTSHVIHFTKFLNDPANKTGCKVIAAYPGGSADIPASADRLEGFTKQLRDEHGVEIVDSIEELCKRVDGVLLESVDGRPHLKQVKPVLAAKKPVFIDKPVAGSLADVVEIYRLAKEAGVPVWSSSTWRFTHGVRNVKEGKAGNVKGCLAFGPCSIESHHPDLYWYGIHTAEALYAVMGPGCETVTRTHCGDADVVVGKWKDGRIGIFRGGRHGGSGAGIVVFGSKGVQKHGHEGGYPVLLKEIVNFFKTGKVPVAPEETIELFAFMSAADESKARGGAPVAIKSVLEKARAEAKEKSSLSKTPSADKGAQVQPNPSPFRLVSETKASARAEGRKKLRIVFFGAHCDDSEVGAGGLMRILADQGHEVISAYATTYRRGRTVDGKPEDPVRRAESTTACEILGAKPYFFPYAHEKLEGPFADKKTLVEIVDWLKKVDPDIVVAHWPLDTHPNHQVVGAAALMAYKHSGRVWGKDDESKELADLGWNLYFYEVNNLTRWDDIETMGFEPKLYLDIGKVHQIKRKAVDCFQSQADYELWKVQDNMHRQRGKECGTEHAEAFILMEAKPGCPLLPVSFLEKE